MSPKKIIFLVIVVLVFVALGIGFMYLANQKPKQVISGKITVWINEGLTDDFEKVIKAFHDADPANKNIQVEVEKKSSTTVSGYNSLLLRAIADGNGPDIFMVQKNEYAPLESQLAKIPSNVIDITDFGRRFDPVFSDLIVSEKNPDTKITTQSLLGVPLGYETLGVFYNRALLRNGAPTSWDQIELLYGQFPAGIFPTNLGLRRTFVPNISDILPFFLGESKVFSYKNLTNITSPFQKYYSFGDLINSTNPDVTADIYSHNNTLRQTESQLKSNKNSTTIDEFLRGNIGMIVGYPSLISELEMSQKRVGGAGVEDLVYTDKIPQFSAKNPYNIAKYSFFGISKNSKNPDQALKFLQFLMSSQAQEISMEIYPMLIPAQTEFHAAAAVKSLSEKFPKAKMDAFLLGPSMSVSVFDYGAKSIFDAMIDANWEDFSSLSSLSGLGERISKAIRCEVGG